MHDEWFKGNYKEAMSINEKLSNINNLLFIESNPCPVKYAAHFWECVNMKSGYLLQK